MDVSNAQALFIFPSIERMYARIEGGSGDSVRTSLIGLYISALFDLYV